MNDRHISRGLAFMIGIALLTGCADEPVGVADHTPGQVVQLVPDAARVGQRNDESGCAYSWLHLSGRVNGSLATVFVPFRRDMGASPRCRAALANEISTLIQAEINDGDAQPVSLCVKTIPTRPDIVLPKGSKRYEAVELAVSGWYFRKREFWSCDDEAQCPPPAGCNLLGAQKG